MSNCALWEYQILWSVSVCLCIWSKSKEKLKEDSYYTVSLTEMNWHNILVAKWSSVCVCAFETLRFLLLQGTHGRQRKQVFKILNFHFVKAGQLWFFKNVRTHIAQSRKKPSAEFYNSSRFHFWELARKVWNFMARTWMIMAPHNFPSFVARSISCLFAIPPNPRVVNHLHRLVR